MALYWVVELVDRSPHCLANRLRALDMVGKRFNSVLSTIVGQAGNNHVYKDVQQQHDFEIWASVSDSLCTAKRALGRKVDAMARNQVIGTVFGRKYSEEAGENSAESV